MGLPGIGARIPSREPADAATVPAAGQTMLSNDQFRTVFKSAAPHTLWAP